MTTRILLIGAGSIGAFFGSRLATIPDILVSALCRSSYDAVKTQGFQIQSSQFGDSTFRPEKVFKTTAEIRQAKLTWHFVVVATKALPDVSDDSTMLDGLVGDDTTIVLIQNGLGIEEPYRQRFPQTTILSGVTIASCAQPTPGVIKHNNWTKTSIGPYLPNINDRQTIAKATQRTKHFVNLLHQAGISDAQAYSHTEQQFIRWHKIAINSAMNPSSVLAGGAGNRELALDADTAEHLTGVIDEVLCTAARILEEPMPMKELKLASPEQILASVRKNTSGSRPSMWQDWEKGGRMELEVILGNPIRAAREKGLVMPRLQSMYALLKMAQEKRERQRTKGKL